MNSRYVQGFSLVEIMIAMTISLVLMAGVMTIMTSSKRTYALQDELARLQENARFVMEDLTFQLRMAGFMGCAKQPPANFTGTWKPISGENDKYIVDSEKSTQKLNHMPKSDILRLSSFSEELQQPDLPTIDKDGKDISNNYEKQVAEAQRLVRDIFQAEKKTFTLNPNSAIPAVNERVIIGDCGGSLIYRVTSVDTTKPTGPVVSIAQLAGGNSFGKAYRWPVDIFRLPGSTTPEIVYDVRGIDKNGDGDSNDSEDGVALFKNDQRFIEGVQSLQVAYGKDKTNDGIADYYTTDANAEGNIVALRISLLMRTANKRFDLDDTEDKTFYVGSIQYNPAKKLEYEAGYRHRVFTSTVSVRNS